MKRVRACDRSHEDESSEDESSEDAGEHRCPVKPGIADGIRGFGQKISRSWRLIQASRPYTWM